MLVHAFILKIIFVHHTIQKLVRTNHLDGKNGNVRYVTIIVTVVNASLSQNSVHDVYRQPQPPPPNNMRLQQLPQRMLRNDDDDNVDERLQQWRRDQVWRRPLYNETRQQNQIYNFLQKII